MAAIEVWTLGQQISQLIVGELDQHGVCFGAGARWFKSVTWHIIIFMHQF